MSTSSRGRILFSAIGTAGDALPLIAVAGALVRRGFECHFLSNEPFAERAEHAGVNFAAVARRQENNLAPYEYSLKNFHFASFGPIREFFRSLDLSTPTLITNVSNISATSIMAELHEIPICRIHLAPFHIRSLASPPSPLRERCSGPMGHTCRRYYLPKVYEQWDTFPLATEYINRFRAECGLKPIRLLSHAEQFIARYIGLFPEWFAPRAADWSERLTTTGFPLEPPLGALTPEVNEFMERRPLVFTPGTGVTDVEAFFSAAAGCCRASGRAGLFLSPNLKASGDFGRNILVRDHVDLELVLPRSALIVHHGGIGTTARALEWAIPQVISPIAFDQPDNARRIVELGAGAVLKREELGAASLWAVVRQLLDDGRVAETLMGLQKRLGEFDGIGSTADELERCFLAAHRS